MSACSWQGHADGRIRKIRRLRRFGLWRRRGDSDSVARRQRADGAIQGSCGEERRRSDHCQLYRNNPARPERRAGLCRSRRRFFREGRLRRRDCRIHEAIQLDPKDAQAYVGRGAAYRGKGDYDRAIADYDEAIRLDPKDARAYRGRGAVCFWKGDYDRAIVDYDEAIRLDPKDARAFHFRGNAYFAKKNYDRAIADYDEAIRLDPKIADAYSKRNLAYRNKTENSAPAEPATSFSATMSVYGISPPADANPKSHDPRDVCGNGREESIEACTKIINGTGLSASLRAGALAHRATEYGAAGKYDLAIRDLDQAIQLAPNDGWAYNLRGQTYGMKGDYNRAIEDFNQAI